MAKTKKKQGSLFLDSTFMFKIVLFLILGSLWVKVMPNDSTVIPLPVGAVIAAIYASHDHFQIDRRIEYVVILFAMFISFWLPIGIELKLY